VRAKITLKDGRVLNLFVEHVVGSLERPMSDAALEGKFADLAKGVLPDPQVRRLMDMCWKVEGLPSVAALAAAAVPAA
jgi:2-methylcitrate dehydratase PrpD